MQDIKSFFDKKNLEIEKIKDRLVLFMNEDFINNGDFGPFDKYIEKLTIEFGDINQIMTEVLLNNYRDLVKMVGGEYNV